MRLRFSPAIARGRIQAPPAKSIAHRLLICAALSGGSVTGAETSGDIAATLRCLRALGARTECEGAQIRFLTDRLSAGATPLDCGESGSTLRFLFPLAMGQKPVTFCGSGRLMERPFSVYEDICREQGLPLVRRGDTLTVCGPLRPGVFSVPGDISSQFVTGLLLALPLRERDSEIHLTTALESAEYVALTRQAQARFGVVSHWQSERQLVIPGGQRYQPAEVAVEGDESNAAFFAGLNLLGGSVTVENMNPNSIQPDKRYKEYFPLLEKGAPELEISQCPDLAPVLMALAAAKNGARLKGTHRLRYKESDRGAAMAQELAKLGVSCTLKENDIRIPGGALQAPQLPLLGHGDHRIVMALSLLLSRTGGVLEGAEAVEKSCPRFFIMLRQLGLEVEEL